MVLALAEGASLPEEAVGKLRDICREIRDTKDSYRHGAAQRAHAALQEPADHDPDALTVLLTEFASRPAGGVT